MILKEEQIIRGLLMPGRNTYPLSIKSLRFMQRLNTLFKDGFNSNVGNFNSFDIFIPNPTQLQEIKENIIARLIEKGGLYGLAAKKYAHHSELSSQVIIECFGQCHHQNSLDFWGRDLVRDIVEYRFYLASELRRELRELMAITSRTFLK
jgi:hypothetical protein